MVDETLVYSYDDSGDWKDLLLSVTRTKNGVTTSGSLSYDAGGNPLTYFNGTNWSFTWRNGRELNSASGNGYSLNYSYDLNGLRTEKKVTKSGTTETHTYLYASGQLLRESFVRNGKTYTLDFAYDLSGKPYFLLATVDGAMSLYYFVTNLQGDVVRITNAQKETLANYSYDAYGKLLSVTNASGTTISDTSNIALINPLRYRGYYYDSETELYYLQSRYYDPTTSRFVNADSYLSTGQDFLGFNSFAYCLNNPVIAVDSSGSAAAVCIEYESNPRCFPWKEAAACGGGAVIVLLVMVLADEVELLPLPARKVIQTEEKAETKAIAKAETDQKQSRKNKHHIVPQFDPRGKWAREMLSELGISVNSMVNLVSINEKYHQILHTDGYYSMINLRLSLAYQRGNGDLARCRDCTLMELCLIKTELSFTSILFEVFTWG